MAEHTNISWADATLNFWIGCTEVSVGEKGACTNCYARTWANRFPRTRGSWGAGAPRVKTVGWVSKLKELERLAIAKLARGEGAFFCFSNSLSDIFDNEVPIEWLAEAFAGMREHAPHVTFLLLTKRPQNIVKRAEAAGGLPPNAAIGCTVVTQKEADRDLPWLLAALASLGAPFAFVSMEPLMEVVDIAWALSRNPLELASGFLRRGMFSPGLETLRGLGWVITGGESGAHARITPLEATQGLRDQCAAAGVPFEHKQNGEWIEQNQRSTSIGFGATLKTQVAFKEVGGNRYERVGKDIAGRLLDGVTHDARPTACA